MSTLIGAALGAGVTLFIWGEQNSAVLEAEEREVRRAVYAEFLDASSAYLNAQIATVQDEKYCLSEHVANVDGEERQACLLYSREIVDGPRDAWFEAFSNLRVYGTDAIVAIARTMNETTDEVDPRFLPFSSAVAGLAGRADMTLDELFEDTSFDQAIDPYNDAANEFTLQVCLDTAVDQDRCTAALAEE
ncbi:hypothetical protein [Agromyces sp. ZXT2-3]|uniref:hypothetical protein n=1 Tax=Agromyces sp. ZXT2-3 TaxID=3461152 RepID=UPI0040551B43